MGGEAVDKDVEDSGEQKKKKEKGIVRREISSVRFRFIIFYFTSEPGFGRHALFLSSTSLHQPYHSMPHPETNAGLEINDPRMCSVFVFFFLLPRIRRLKTNLSWLCV